MSCLDYAFEIYERRAKDDTNPMIAQALDSNGKSEGHWYYRSEEVIASDLWFWARRSGGMDKIIKFEAHISLFPKKLQEHFVKDRFKKDDFETDYAEYVGWGGVLRFRELVSSF